MNNLHFIAIGVAVALAVGFSMYKYVSRRKPTIYLESETFDGELTFQQVTAFFKSLGLTKGKCTPFIVKGDAPEIRNSFENGDLLQNKSGYICVIAGVYEEGKDAVRKGKIFYVKELDEKLHKTLGGDRLVVLS